MPRTLALANNLRKLLLKLGVYLPYAKCSVILGDGYA